MKKSITFITTNESKSIEVEMCVIPSFHDGKIYFYYADYDTYWDSIEKIGDLNQTKNFDTKLGVRSATYLEICDCNLHRNIQAIKIYEGYGKTARVSYVPMQGF